MFVVKEAKATNDKLFVFIKTVDGKELPYVQYRWIVKVFERLRLDLAVSSFNKYYIKALEELAQFKEKK